MYLIHTHSHVFVSIVQQLAFTVRKQLIVFLQVVCTLTHTHSRTHCTTCIHKPQLFNTAVTRAKQWLVVVGEPITLCTVGSNRLLWGEYIKNCQQDGVFEYQNAEKFESCLEDKIVVR